jgi:hypothetical protein
MAVNYNQTQPSDFVDPSVLDNLRNAATPSREEYFPELMGTRSFDRAMQYRQKHIMPMQAHTMKMQSHAMSMRGQDLANEKLKFDLMQSRQKAKSQLDFMEKLPDLMGRIESITSDPEKDSYTATKNLIGLQMEYLPSAQHNPLIGNLFNFAGNSINVDRIRQEKEEREAEKEESRKLGVMTQLAQIGATDALRTAAGEEIDEKEAPLLALGQAYEKRDLAKTQKEADKLKAAAESAAIGRASSTFKSYESALRGMTVKSTQTDWSNMTAPTMGDIKQISNQVSKGFDIGKANKQELAATYIDVMRRSGITVNKVAVLEKAENDTENLYRETLEKVLEQQRLFGQYGQPETTSTVDTIFNT